jgi:hypothetical protein
VRSLAAGNWRNQESREALALSIGQAHRADWPIDDPDREPRIVTGDDDAASRTFDLPSWKYLLTRSTGSAGSSQCVGIPVQSPGIFGPFAGSRSRGKGRPHETQNRC